MPRKRSILVVGGAVCDDILAFADIVEAESVDEALARLASGPFDAAIVTNQEGVDALAAFRPSVPIVVYDFEAGASDAARYVRLGAEDVASCGDELARVVQRILSRPVSDELERAEPWRRMLVGSSASIERAATVIRLVAPRKSTVLITGETGTGKELIARAVHMASPRAHLPLVTVNVAALPANLLEAELFGHVKGAFTGAIQQRVGRFEQAHRSTLFLDEIGDLPLDIQTKLLRFLQERELERVGSSETLRVDVRLITASNVDLAARVREGRFREDLFYRINVVPIAAPSLRDRPEDIPALANHLVERICHREGLPLRRLTFEATVCLQGYAWPGNVRQLENAVEMAVALSGDRELLSPADFLSIVGSARPVVQPAAGTIAVPESGLDFDRTVGNIERKILEEALAKTGGNKSAAADMLGLKRTTLSAKLRSLAASA